MEANKPTDLDLESLDSGGVEEDKEEEEMGDQNLKWMARGPLALLGALHKMPKREERMNINFNLDNVVKAEYNLELLPIAANP